MEYVITKKDWMNFMENRAMKYTPREQNVLDLLKKGFSFDETADILEIKLSTVKTHVLRMYEKRYVSSLPALLSVEFLKDGANGHDLLKNIFLSDMERKVLSIMGMGKTQEECAEILSYSIHTIKGYFLKLGRKLGTSGQSELICKFHNYNNYRKLEGSKETKNAVIFDIDEVLCKTKFIFDEIHKLKLTGQEKWDYFNSNVYRCKPNIWCLNLVKKMKDDNTEIYFITARNNNIRSITYDFIKNSLGHEDFHLKMRNDKDYRDAYAVKFDIASRIVRDKGVNILFAIDDDIRNCNMYKSMGIDVLHKI